MQQSSVPTAGQSSSVTWECDCLAHRFGNAADNGLRQPRYPTDMTDAEWAAVRPLLPVPGWMRGRGGRPEAYCHRAVLDAIRYLIDRHQVAGDAGRLPTVGTGIAFFRR
ncbi:transposase [Streptomyces mirabilis]|uniref:transposase n=1 Tax=Streptomyces mirabilis TaxID=68239 RepID=UPI0033F556D4